MLYYFHIENGGRMDFDEHGLHERCAEEALAMGTRIANEIALDPEYSNAKVHVFEGAKQIGTVAAADWHAVMTEHDRRQSALRTALVSEIGEVECLRAYEQSAAVALVTVATSLSQFAQKLRICENAGFIVDGRGGTLAMLIANAAALAESLEGKPLQLPERFT